MARPVIPRTVWLLGLVSCFTDISSEMVSSILPVSVVHLQLSLAVRLVDGLFRNTRSASHAVDRWRGHKLVAAWYGCRRSEARSPGERQRVERIRHGPFAARGGHPHGSTRRADFPATRPQDLASAFAHLAMDTAGMFVGPVLAF
jgi:hypothetical protein